MIATPQALWIRRRNVRASVRREDEADRGHLRPGRAPERAAHRSHSLLGRASRCTAHPLRSRAMRRSAPWVSLALLCAVGCYQSADAVDARDGSTTNDAGTDAAAVAAHATCTRDADCPMGSRCTAVDGDVLPARFYCRPSCSTDAQCISLVGPASACVAMPSADGSGATVCAIPCAIDGHDCTPGGCRPTTLETTASMNILVVECSTAGTGGPSYPCGTSSARCSAECVCYAPDHVCRLLCSNPGTTPSPCPGGTPCTMYSPTRFVVNGVEWGLCR